MPRWGLRPALLALAGGGLLAVIGALILAGNGTGAPSIEMALPPRPGVSPPAGLIHPPAPRPVEAAAPSPAMPALPVVIPAVPPAAAVPALPELPGRRGADQAPSFAKLREIPPPSALAPAPRPGLLETTPLGNLPAVAPDGTQPWRVYGRPFHDREERPRVAVVVTDLGIDKAATEAAITRLPPEISLAFSPYGRDLDQWIRKARAAGHEVLIGLPMEQAGHPARDPGPFGLHSDLAAAEISRRLDTLLGRTSGYVGLIAPSGSPFLAASRMGAVAATLKRRGLMLVGDSAAMQGDGPPTVVISRVIDDKPFREAVDARLGQVAAAAVDSGSGLAVTTALPVTLDSLTRWIAGLAQRGLVLAPVTSLVRSR